METTDPYVQSAHGLMSYPAPGTLNRLLFRAPLFAWRMGMGNLLGPHILVLTTWGRKSHLPRPIMLSYTPTPQRIYIGAGWGARCDWYRNLTANPRVTLQVWDEQVTGLPGEAIIPALARRVTDEDEFRQVARRLFETGSDAYFRPWLQSLGIRYDVEDMVARRERVHQVALDLQPILPAAELIQAGYPPAMETDLRWVWAAMGLSFMLGWKLGKRRR
jgi:deazaflavin-dependent oxidoreductase (nitroreductase family)